MIERPDKDQKEPEEKVQEGSKLEDRFVPTEQREALETTRRSEEERHEGEEPPPDGEERRETPDRRLVIDRREMSYGINCKTSVGMTQIEDWLDGNCMEDDMVKKSFNVMFELENDKTNFIENFIKG